MNDYDYNRTIRLITFIVHRNKEGGDENNFTAASDVTFGSYQPFVFKSIYRQSIETTLPFFFCYVFDDLK